MRTRPPLACRPAPSLRRRLVLALPEGRPAAAGDPEPADGGGREQDGGAQPAPLAGGGGTRYNDDWLRLGAAAPPSPRQFSSYWTEAGRLPAWLKPYQSPGFF
jgi:hypothetical protein